MPWIVETPKSAKHYYYLFGKSIKNNTMKFWIRNTWKEFFFDGGSKLNIIIECSTLYNSYIVRRPKAESDGNDVIVFGYEDRTWNPANEVERFSLFVLWNSMYGCVKSIDTENFSKLTRYPIRRSYIQYDVWFVWVPAEVVVFIQTSLSIY